MAVNILSLEESRRLLEIGKTNLRPQTIITAKIAYRTAEEALTLRIRAGEIITDAELTSIVGMRRNIDALYVRWARGEFTNDMLVPDPFITT